MNFSNIQSYIAAVRKKKKILYMQIAQTYGHVVSGTIGYELDVSGDSMITAHVYKARVRVDSRFESGVPEIEAHAIGRGDHVVFQARGVVESVAAQRRQSAQSRQRDSIVRPSYVRGRVTVVEPARNGH